MDNSMTKAYHITFLGLCIAGFVFGVLCASAGIVIILRQPESTTAGIVVEAISGLGFFFSRWSQKEFRYCLKEAARNDAILMLANSRFTKEDVVIFREFMKMIMRSPSSGKKGEDSPEDITNDL